MAWNIYPTEGAVGSFLSNPTNYLRETQIARRDLLLGYSRNFVVWQYTLSDGGSLSVNIAAGEAFVSGYYVYCDSVTNVGSLTGSSTNYIFLQLVKTGGLVTSAQFVANTTGTIPTDGVLVGWAITHSDHVDSVHNAPISSQVVVGNYTGTGSSPLTVIVGVTAKFGLIGGGLLSGSIVPTGSYGWYQNASANGRALAGSSDLYPEIIAHGFKITGTGNFNTVATDFTYTLWT